ncbi:MAG: TonB-dependent receptor, partial [Bdellovibrionales bacterium]|nr:TonB-dependent receptor [Bdellovibrionales bacterium]NQZ19028.1 TonB-dependent receptor [Bdellovibrionales bacterium]
FLDHRYIGNYIVQGNEELQPERSLSYQLGHEVIISKRSGLSLNAFFNQVSNMISPQNANNNAAISVFQYANIDSVETQGLEFNYRASFTSWLNNETSLSYTMTENQVNGNEIPLRPNTSGRSSLNWGSSSSGYSLSTIATYTGTQYADIENNQRINDFFTLDLRLNYRTSKESTFYMGIENLFDEKRPAATDDSSLNFDLRPGVGRFLYLGFKVRS